ncbi:MAG: DUF547 domain-containing protein [Acidimicrobiia bacterium]
MPTSPSVPRVLWSIARSLVTVRSPKPRGKDRVDHSEFGVILSRLRGDAMQQLPALDGALAHYVNEMESIDPDQLTRNEALAYWLNLYNALALRLAASAARQGIETVLGLPGGFTAPAVSVAGESLSLNAIEHAKIRRFADPRIHGGLVCGSASCPALRREPFDGDVDNQLDEQMRLFLARGALQPEPDHHRVVLSSIFSWFGGDFVHPRRMPTLLPAKREMVLSALTPWLPESTAEWIATARPQVRFGSYDWRLGCAVD